MCAREPSTEILLSSLYYIPSDERVARAAGLIAAREGFC
jgi:hypothetical protein